MAINNWHIEKYNSLVKIISSRLENHEPVTRKIIERVATSCGILDKTIVKELTEYAIVETARKIAITPMDIEVRYNRIVDLYNRQTNLSFRTSQSILLNQYSTPVPIAFMMGVYCDLDTHVKTFFEPSAGNGCLTIASVPRLGIVNEIDSIRNENLKRTAYSLVLKKDASYPFEDYQKSFDAVLSNPPFGSLNREVYVGGKYRIYALDHYMVINALDTMKDDGKGAFIVGGHFRFDEKGRIRAGKNRIFLNYLFHYYHVEDIISINGQKLYSKQGTSFDVSIILINGRKKNPYGACPLKSQMDFEEVSDFKTLYERVMNLINQSPNIIETKANALLQKLLKLKNKSLEGVYTPSSKAKSLETQVPDSMDFELHKALKRITEEVGGDMDNFVRHRLGYATKKHLYDVLSAEQIDAVGMAIYNIEAMNQAIIIGDQTGIGKGRVASSMVRYAIKQGIRPIFITEKANLFSDFYRDLSAIGSAHLKPFIVNTKESKSDIKDEDGLVIYQAPNPIEQQAIFESKDLKGYDFVMATYSQFNSLDKKPLKPSFLEAIAQDSIIILDESHNASGSSNTGRFMQNVMRKVKGGIFLSATFAKRPDNMPIYAMKTCISEANLSSASLIEAVTQGGVALQEILSSQLVAEGQMIRRERSYEGIEVNYIAMNDLAEQHKAIADNITDILRDIISFQANYVDHRVQEMDEILKDEGKEVKIKEGTQNIGVDNQPYFSKIFNVINQMLFAIKAGEVANHAIRSLKQGLKPVIAFSSTMGSFLEELSEENAVFSEGEQISTDFALILQKGLEGVLRYSVTEVEGEKTHYVFDLIDLGKDAQIEYERITNKIKRTSSGICISPIDVIVQTIEKAGYEVGEVTGRKLRVQLNDSFNKGIVLNRKKLNTNDAFRRFNNNELDVLLINQSGSTGASAHAIVTSKVPKEQVKQRVMIVLQPELDINIEIQKRGRINRTGQILKPKYDYVSSVIPAELRLMMMLQKKLKSLDANTSSNQKQSESLLNVPDFLNKYGDDIVYDYLKENPEINYLLGNPLKFGDKEEIKENASLKVSGRVAVLSVQMQEEFYNEIKERYENQIAYLKQTGEYDLEVEEMDLKAKTIYSKVLQIGAGGYSSFGDDSIIEKVSVNVLKKPYKALEVKNIIQQTLGDLNTQSYKEKLIQDFELFSKKSLEQEIEIINKKYELLIRDIPNDKKLKKVNTESAENYLQAITDRKKELENSKLDAIRLEERNHQNKEQYIKSLFSYFNVGKRLYIDFSDYSMNSFKILSVFLGFKIDNKKKNPYAPSSIGLRFAIASSHKYLEIPASMSSEINAIKGASIDSVDKGLENTLFEWEEALRDNVKDKAIRFIITGNILQSFSTYKGKLVSYTTEDGQIKKGILMPENWDYEKNVGGKISVPILKAYKIIKGLSNGKDVVTTNGVTLIKQYNDSYKIIVASSLKQGGELYLNEDLLKLVEDHNFQQSSKNMVATLPLLHLEKALEIMQEQLGDSVKVTGEEMEQIGQLEQKHKKRNKINLPPSESEDKHEQQNEIELEAQALKLKLKLLAFKFKRA